MCFYESNFETMAVRSECDFNLKSAFIRTVSAVALAPYRSGDPTMLRTTKIAFVTALVIGVASVAQANDIDTSPSTAQSAREWQEYLGQTQKHQGNAGTGYNYFASPNRHEDPSQSENKNRSR
jgi:hypothetical protein